MFPSISQTLTAAGVVGAGSNTYVSASVKPDTSALVLVVASANGGAGTSPSVASVTAPWCTAGFSLIKSNIAVDDCVTLWAGYANEGDIASGAVTVQFNNGAVDQTVVVVQVNNDVAGTGAQLTVSSVLSQVSRNGVASTTITTGYATLEGYSDIVVMLHDDNTGAITPTSPLVEESDTDCTSTRATVGYWVGRANTTPSLTGTSAGAAGKSWIAAARIIHSVGPTAQGSRATAVSSAASATLVTTVAAGNVSVGDLIVVGISCDNAGVAGVSPISSVTDSGGNVYTAALSTNRTAASAANDGVSVAIFAAICTTALTSGSSTITANFSPNTTAKVMGYMTFTRVWSKVPVQTNQASSAGSGNWALPSGIAPKVGFLSVLVAGNESNTPPAAALGVRDTDFGSWVTGITAASGGGGGDATKTSMRMQWCIVAQNLTPTAGGTATNDWIGAQVAFPNIPQRNMARAFMAMTAQARPRAATR